MLGIYPHCCWAWGRSSCALSAAQQRAIKHRSSLQHRCDRYRSTCKRGEASKSALTSHVLATGCIDRPHLPSRQSTVNQWSRSTGTRHQQQSRREKSSSPEAAPTSPWSPAKTPACGESMRRGPVVGRCCCAIDQLNPLDQSNPHQTRAGSRASRFMPVRSLRASCAPSSSIDTRPSQSPFNRFNRHMQGTSRTRTHWRAPCPSMVSLRGHGRASRP